MMPGTAALRARMRWFALSALVLIAAYYELRWLASGCEGSQCDWFIPFSLLIPLLAFVLAGVTGVLSIATASGVASDVVDDRNRRIQVGWRNLLAVVTLIGVVGTVASVVLLRDNPDAFVDITTTLVALVPLTALFYATAGLPRRHEGR